MKYEKDLESYPQTPYQFSYKEVWGLYTLQFS